jgi:hypothetical protein
MHFDDGKRHGGQGIPERDAGVREAARVDHDAVAAPAGGVDPVDQRALVVGLEGLQARPSLARHVLQVRVDLAQGRGAVDLGLALPEEVEVGAVQHQDAHRRASLLD